MGIRKASETWTWRVSKELRPTQHWFHFVYVIDFMGTYKICCNKSAIQCYNTYTFILMYICAHTESERGMYIYIVIYIYIFQVCLCALQLKPMTLNLICVTINSKSFTYKCQTDTYISFALINGLHNNKLETSVMQLFELIKNWLLHIFKCSQNQGTTGSKFGGGGRGEVRFTESEKHWFWLFQKHQTNGCFHQKPNSYNKGSYLTFSIAIRAMVIYQNDIWTLIITLLTAMGCSYFW